VATAPVEAGELKVWSYSSTAERCRAIISCML